ncbi:MAG: hypothetical protein KIT10_10555 [Flavobacteriales bacterium]|nr:hypothetical protein [Flavobacteriales bacterium]
MRHLLLTSLLIPTHWCGAQGMVKDRELVVSVRAFGVPDGLLHRHVWQVVEDRDGFIWMATSGGAQRFDGNVFTSWTTAEGLTTNAIAAIWPDAKGNFWLISQGLSEMGTVNSIDILHPRTGAVRTFAQHFGADVQLQANEICGKAIVLDDSTLVMGAAGRLIFYDKSGFRELPVAVDGILRPLMMDRQGAVWCMRFLPGGPYLDLVKVDPTGRVERDPSSPFRTGIIGDVQGCDMRTKDHGFYFVAEQENKSIHEFWIPPQGQVRRMTTRLPDEAIDRLWKPLLMPLGNDRWLVGNSVRQMRPGDDPLAAPLLQGLGPQLPLDHDGPMRAWMDQRGNIWICGQLGLWQLRIRETRFQRWLQNHAGRISERNSIRGMALIGDSLFVNTEKNGLWRLDSRSGDAVCLEDGSGSLRYGLASDGRGGLYGSSGNGLYHWKDGRLRGTVSTPYNMVWNILPLEDGRLLLGTLLGLAWSDTTLGHYSPIPPAVHGMPESSPVNHLCRDPQGKIWASTTTGLFELDAEGAPLARWWIGSTTNPLPADMFHHVFTDDDGIMWLATASHGLLRWDRVSGSVRAITMRDGLPSNGIYATYADTRGNLWLPTDNGIARYVPNSGQVAIFNEEDGIAHHEFNRLAHLQGPDGMLYFGGLDGITVFHPDSLLERTGRGHAPFVIASVQQFIGARDKLEDRSSEVIGNGTITLLPNDRFFTLRMALLSYEEPGNILYGWRVDGIDQDWNLQREPTIRFASLPYGEHVLRLRAKGADGVWNPKELSLLVRMVRPWYLRWWAFALMAVLIFASVYGLFRYRLARVRAMVRMRDRIALDLHDEVGSTLSSVALFSTVVNRRAADRSPEEGAMLRRIAENSAQAMESMNDIVWSVNSRYDDLGDVLDRMQQYAGPLAEAQDWDLHITMSDELRSMKLGMNERKNLYLVFKEAVNNAAKYARCDRMNISVARKGDLIELSVADNGVGLEVGSNGGSGLGGNGLRSMEQRAADIRGILEVLSAPGQGTTITLRFRPQRG